MISTLTFAYASEDGVESAAGEVNAQTDASTADGYDIASYGSNTFTALNDKLTDGNEDISINNDYHYDNKSDMYFSDGISIENKSIKINGNNHVIDGTSINTIFQISNSNVEICNLTLYNVNQNTINLENSTLTTNNVIFSGENQDYRAVYMFNSSYTSDGDTFIDNLHEYGSAIYGDTSYLNLNNATFENDRDNIWGLVYLDNGEFKITDTVFNDITSKYSTAIYAWNSMGSIENCEFINLYANLTAGAIGFKSPESTILIQNCSFVNTTAPKNGGAIYVDFNTKIKNNATIVINDCQFIDCTSSFGGAIVQLEGTLQINNSNFTDNLALYKGGAIHTSYANVEINDCLFENNEVILLDEGITQGGTVYFDYGNLRIFNSTFKNSSADEGKSLYANEANYTIRDSYFENGIYTRFDEEMAELSNNIFVNEDENTLDEREYYTVYDGVGVQFDIDPFIIGEGNLTADYFNLVDYGLVSPVSNQGSNGACWAFMTTGALESAILKATNKKLLLDISENNIQNTGLKYSPIGDNDLIEFGAGNVATSYLLSWLGMTSTEDDVYDELGKLSPVIDNSSKYYIYEIVTLPKYTIDGISTLKKALIDYGAIGIGVLGASGGEEENYNEYTSAAYESKTTTMNHGVTLVGWNDTFSRYNFNVTPPGDGAWIIKNSWGTDWGDNGYYYVSYYDKAIGYEDYPFAIIVNNPTYPYEKNYQYDPIADINLNGYTDYEITSYMNIYEAVDDDLIAAVGTYFKDAGIEYVIEVQTDNMTYQQKGISKHHGFETIALDKFIPIYNGSSFIVKNYVDYVPLTADYRNKVPPESS
ncbi:MAG: hypothetical protein J6S29_03550, partial [Methanosphaera sp.]|nr:hypothetical protein [Methanosphaera sp.]